MSARITITIPQDLLDQLQRHRIGRIYILPSGLSLSGAIVKMLHQEFYQDVSVLAIPSFARLGHKGPITN